MVLNMSAFKWRIAKFVCWGCHFSLKYCKVSHGVDDMIKTYLKEFMAGRGPVVNAGRKMVMPSRF